MQYEQILISTGLTLKSLTGMFFFSKRQDIFVMKWDAVSEDVVEIAIDEEEKEKYREGNLLSDD